jgi:hypothetical protein
MSAMGSRDRHFGCVGRRDDDLDAGARARRPRGQGDLIKPGDPDPAGALEQPGRLFVDDFAAERDTVVRARDEGVDADPAEPVLVRVDLQLGPPPAVAAPETGDVADLSIRVVVEQDWYVPELVCLMREAELVVDVGDVGAFE